jgi:predicted  nucleic acid-binding Zn-ribbon protein
MADNIMEITARLIADASAIKEQLAPADQAFEGIKKSIGEKMKAVSETIKSVGDKMKEVGDKAKEMGKEMMTGFGFLETLKDVIGEKVLHSMGEFEEQMTQLGFSSNMTKEEFKKLQDGLLELSTEIPHPVAELTKLAQIAEQLGLKSAPDILQFVKTGAALKDVAGASDADVQALAGLAKAFGGTAKDIGPLADGVTSLHEKTGVATSTIIQGAAEMKGLGVCAGLTATQLLAVATSAAQAGTNGETFGRLVNKIIGLDVQMDGASGQAVEHYTEKQDALKRKMLDVEGQMVRLQSAQGNLGKSHTDNTSKVQELQRKYAEYEQELEKLTPATSKAGEKIGGLAKLIGMSTKDFEALAKTHPDQILMKIAEGLSKGGSDGKIMAATINEITGGDRNLTLALEKLLPGLKTLGTNMGEADKAAKEHKLLMDQATKAWDEFLPSLMRVWNSFKVVWLQLTNDILPIFSKFLIDVVMPQIKKLAEYVKLHSNTIKANVKDMVDKVTGWFKTWCDWIDKNKDKIAGITTTLLTEGVKWLPLLTGSGIALWFGSTLLGNIGSAVSGVLDLCKALKYLNEIKIASTFSTWISTVIGAGAFGLTGLSAALIAIFAVGGIVAGALALLETFNNPTGFDNFITRMIDTKIPALGKAIDGICDWLVKLTDALFNWNRETAKLGPGSKYGDAGPDEQKGVGSLSNNDDGKRSWGDDGGYDPSGPFGDWGGGGSDGMSSLGRQSLVPTAMRNSAPAGLNMRSSSVSNSSTAHNTYSPNISMSIHVPTLKGLSDQDYGNFVDGMNRAMRRRSGV